MIIPETAAAEPTERSTCPAIIRSVPGIQTMPVTARATAILRKFSISKKYSLAAEKYVKRPTKKTINGAEAGIERFLSFSTSVVLDMNPLPLTSCRYKRSCFNGISGEL